jgi:hypothetical protein
MEVYVHFLFSDAPKWILYSEAGLHVFLDKHGIFDWSLSLLHFGRLLSDLLAEDIVEEGQHQTLILAFLNHFQKNQIACFFLVIVNGKEI